MFSDAPNLNELRQGDVLRDLLCPLMLCSEAQIRPSTINTVTSEPPLGLDAPLETRHGRNWLRIETAAAYGFCVVLSQCCDLQLNNGRIAQSTIVVSPLRLVADKERQEPKRTERILKNYDDTQQIGKYYIPENAPLNADYLVDFSFVAAIPNSEYNTLLGAKVLQLTEIERVSFKRKLSSFFGRPTQEELDAGLYATNDGK
jgi:hypothetical protein